MLQECPILLVEDEESDAFLMQRAFQKARLLNPLHHVWDGVEAKDYLSGAGEYADREKYPFPCLVLLDLKMPRMSGFELLEWIKTQSVCKRLITVVLTSSKQSPDINRAYDLGANSYLVKPGSPDELLELLKRVGGYWLFCNVPGECQPTGQPARAS